LIFWCIWIQRIVLISIRFSSYSAVLWRISASFTLPTAVNNPGKKSTSLINYRLAEKKKHYRAIYCSAIVQNENSPLTWLFLRYFILCFVRFRNDVPRFCSRTFYGSLNQFRFLSHTFLANFFLFPAIQYGFKQIINWTILYPSYFSNIVLMTNLLAYRIGGTWVFNQNRQLNVLVAGFFWQHCNWLVRILACESLCGATTGFYADKCGLAKVY